MINGRFRKKPVAILLGMSAVAFSMGMLSLILDSSIYGKGANKILSGKGEVAFKNFNKVLAQINLGRDDEQMAKKLKNEKILDGLRASSRSSKDLHTIYFAGGCFWGTEAYFKKIPGVEETEVGYANGNSDNPSYEDVTRGSGHSETVKIVYDANVVSFYELLLHYMRTIDPTSVNRQGNDIGIQYRTGIYFDKDDMDSYRQASVFLDNKSKELGQKLAVELLPLDQFFKAEEYHQDYLDKNPNGYCHVNLSLADEPLFDATPIKVSEEKLKDLSPDVYNITQNKGTEAPFSHPYDHETRDGIYVDVVTGTVLFSSEDKYDSGCGWPAFSKSINNSLIDLEEDYSYGMSRIEVLSKDGNHLGHVFSDGPSEKGGLRYCINGASLRFIPKEEMKNEGYGEYLALFKD